MNDSGAWTPESLEAQLMKANKMILGWALSDSCTLHDLQSLFRLPTRRCMGNGGLESRDAMQLRMQKESMISHGIQNHA
jgi:hypothetical protein